MRIRSFLTILTSFAMPAAADDAALLMGVDRYENLGRVNDATDMLSAQRVLQDAGFAVSTLSNGSGREMVRLLNDFSGQAGDADRLVVALNGMFITDETQNWFVAADAVTPQLFGMGDTLITLDNIMAVLAQTPGQAILALGYDTDDDSGIGQYFRNGLTNLNIPQGVTVITGDPERIAGLLEQGVAQPGGDVMTYVRNDGRMTVQGFTPVQLVMQPRDRGRERDVSQVDPVGSAAVAWAEARQLDTDDAYRDFLFRYPDNPHVAEARQRLDAIENDPRRIARLDEDALGLTRNDRREIQSNLTALDYDTRGVDGIFGSGSRAAIRGWQQAQGFPVTSFVTQEQINRLAAQGDRRRVEIEAEENRARQEAERLDRAYWDEKGRDGNAAGYRAYLDRYPEGLFANEANEKLADLSQRSNTSAVAKERALNIDPSLSRLIENRLNQQGFNVGRVDGAFDRNTRTALRRFQARYNLEVTGYVDQPTLARIIGNNPSR